MAVRAVTDDLTYVSPSIASLIVDGALDGARPAAATAVRALSPREREVLRKILWEKPRHYRPEPMADR